MLRRASAALLLPQQRRVAAAVALLATSSTPTFTARACATNANYRAGGGGRPRASEGANNGNTRRGSAPRVLPPAFDIVHWNDDDIAAGHLLRVVYQDSYIVLDYHRQASRVRPSPAAVSDGDAAEDGSGSGEAEAAAPAPQRRGGHAERVVTVTLPPVYIARFLGVLEGRSDQVDVQSRFTTATFAKKAGTEAQDKTFVLHCSSRRPTSGQAQTAGGQDVSGETVDWTVEMDPAESLMLHRFLTQALQYNTGFSRRT